jgi:murein L,D-transpeptidase YcbB/YkuD
MEQASQYELALSAAMLRYLDDLRHGVIDPRTLGIGLPAPADRDDVVRCLHGAVDRGRLGGAVECARPVMEEYRLLRAALKRHRTLAAALAASPPLTATLHPGDRFAGAARLRARLNAFGDLTSAPSAPVNIGVYSGSLVEGVKHFQSRHGLDADGVIGRATWRELSVPPAHRARQIELALERLRWLPHQIDAALLVLNIPLFELRGWDHGWMGDPAFTMKAIVGRPVTPTPVLRGTMESVIFRPYWNVPRSILRQEFLPTLWKDPGLLVREDMEIVRGDGDDADVVAATAHNLDLLDRGRLRLRQRPGPKNALGFIKFVLPNEEYVYLHGTPAQRLFARSQRAFSHGCVRVEDPVALAEWVFAGSNEWNRERITETISTSTVISRSWSTPRLSPRRTAQCVSLRISTARTSRSTAPCVPDGNRKELPASDATGVDVHEVGGPVEADAPALHREGGIAEPDQGNACQADVNRPSFHVQAVRRHSFAAVSEHLVGRG